MKTFSIKEQSDGSFLVCLEDDKGNVWPSTVKPTARLAAARLLQLMNLGPVGPQTYPEQVCIGSFELAPDA